MLGGQVFSGVSAMDGGYVTVDDSDDHVYSAWCKVGDVDAEAMLHWLQPSATRMLVGLLVMVPEQVGADCSSLSSALSLHHVGCTSIVS